MNTHGCLGWVVGDVVVEEGLLMMLLLLLGDEMVEELSKTFGLVGWLGVSLVYRMTRMKMNNTLKANA